MLRQRGTWITAPTKGSFPEPSNEENRRLPQSPGIAAKGTIRTIWESIFAFSSTFNPVPGEYFRCFGNGDPGAIRVSQLSSTAQAAKKLLEAPAAMAYRKLVNPLTAAPPESHQATLMWTKPKPRKALGLIGAGLLVLLSACTSLPLEGQYSPAAARQKARRDFAAGQPKIYLAGGIGVYEPGIGEKEKSLVAALPRDSSLAGCTNPRVRYAQGYASAYNSEILTLIRQSH